MTFFNEDKKKGTPPRFGGVFLLPGSALLYFFNIQAVLTAFLFAMCIHYQQHKTPHRAAQSHTEQSSGRRTTRTADKNRTTNTTGNRSEASRSTEATEEPQKAPQDLRINAASLHACTIGAKARRTKQATAEAAPLMFSDRPAASRSRPALTSEHANRTNTARSILIFGYFISQKSKVERISAKFKNFFSPIVESRLIVESRTKKAKSSESRTIKGQTRSKSNSRKSRLNLRITLNFDKAHK